MRAINCTCERFCACNSHACLSHKTDPPSQQNMTGTIELFSKFVIVYYTKGRNLTFKTVYSILPWAVLKKKKLKIDTKKPDKTDLPFWTTFGPS